MVFAPWSDDPNYGNARAVALAIAGRKSENDLRDFNVITVGVPGVGRGASGLTTRQGRDLKRGSFDSVSEAQLEAFEKAYRWAFGHDFDKETQLLHLWGGSQGASNAVSAAEVASKMGYEIGDFVMGPNVALIKRHFLKLIWGYIADGAKGMKLIGQYGMSYEDPADPVLIQKTHNGVFIRRMLAAPRSHLLPVIAMAKGRDRDRIGRLIDSGVIKDRFVSWAGEDDPISSPEDREDLHWMAHTRLRKMGGTAITVTLDKAPHGISSDQAATRHISMRFLRPKKLDYAK